MLPVMFGSLILLAASFSPHARPAPPAVAHSPVFQPSNGVTARAGISVRIISGVKFGAERGSASLGGSRRATQLTDGEGLLRAAELLEFQ